MVIVKRVPDRRKLKRCLAVAFAFAAVVGGLNVQVARGQTAAQESAPKGSFEDPLDAPALMRTSPGSRPLMSVVGAGRRLVAAGMRGLIVISDDGGNTWAQATVPVQSDLLALSFPTASEGWAVGHDGVVLHSTDGGKTWRRQLDGRIAAHSLAGIYQQAIAGGDLSAKPYLDQLQLNYKAGPTLPFLSVLFENASTGFVVGSFGMIAATTDGGKTWQPFLDHIDDPQFLHLNSIQDIGGNVYIAAEKGTIFRFDRQSGRFVPTVTGYAGSFFGIVGNSKVLLAFGLRGTVYRSSDAGSTWAPVTTPLHAAITGAAYLQQRHAFVFVTSAGEIAVADDMGGNFRSLEVSKPTVFTAVHALGDSEAVLSGLDGARVMTLR
jgi:photosystem II stability/assembly factor-like uncharacterized protein